MVESTSATVVLVETGLLLVAVLLAQSVLVRRLPVEVVPGVLRSRVVLSNRLRPWLILGSALMVLAGLALQLR